MKGACDLASAARSFLRYLHLAGLIEEPRWYGRFRRSPIWDGMPPRGLEPATIEKLLTSDRRTLVGRRDHAIPLLLSRLGLRAGKVARLRLVSVGHQTNLSSTSARRAPPVLTAASCLRRFASVEAPIRRVRDGDPVRGAKHCSLRLRRRASRGLSRVWKRLRDLGGLRQFGESDDRGGRRLRLSE
jgi:hypothetical protein